MLETVLGVVGSGFEEMEGIEGMEKNAKESKSRGFNQTLCSSCWPVAL